MPNMGCIEIELTGKCNLRCTHCNRFCDAAPTSDELSVAQFAAFIDESMELRHPWQRITLLGGEPFLHSDLGAIFDELSRYVSVCASEIKLVTNGTAPNTIDALSKVPDWCNIRSTSRRKLLMTGKFNPEFCNVFIAPAESMEDVTACRIPATCGIALNWHGYAVCGQAASMLRVLGRDEFAKSLAECTPEAMCGQMKSLCGICGGNLNHRIPCDQDATVHPFWREALDEYHTVTKPTRVYE
jgi:hypothetical protein